MVERGTKEGRVEAARLALVICRDRLQEPAAALAATDKLLSEAPDDGEAIDLVLSGCFAKEQAKTLLQRSERALVAELTADPLSLELVDRLARVSKALENAPLRQAALGAAVALGDRAEGTDRELALLDQRVSRLPQIAIDDASLPDLADPDDQGPLTELFRALGVGLGEALGPGLAAFGVTKKERVDPKDGLPIRNEVAAWVGALGIGEFDLYVGGRDPNGVYAVPGEPPTLIIGSAISAPLASAHRQAVARELFAVRRGTTILRHREPTDIAALLVALCRLGGLELASPPYAMLAEFERLLGKGLPRRARRLLPELVQPLANTQADPLGWVRAATSSLDRMAAIAAGDVSWVLATPQSPRGQLGASAEAQARSRRLLSFVLSPTYLRLREQLGMGVR
jgi:hypothetical protein